MELVEAWAAFLELAQERFLAIADPSEGPAKEPAVEATRGR